MDSVGREFAELNAEHIRSMREQQRLTELLQRCETERVQALRSLHDTKAQLKECKCSSFFSVGNFLIVISVLFRSCYRSDGSESTFTLRTSFLRDVVAGS
jgi:hypothetical protein